MSGWSTVLLGDMASISRHGVDPTTLKPDTRYIGLEHIPTGGGTAATAILGEFDLASTKFAFTDRHVLFGKLRPNLGKVSRPGCSGVCSTDILPILPGARLDAGYLAWFLRRPEVTAWAAGRTAGANLPRLSPAELVKLRVPLPPLEEQRRIAAVLDQVDALRAKRRGAIAYLDTLPQAMFRDMFGDGEDASVRRVGRFAARKVSDVCELVVDCVNRTAPVVSGLTPYKMLRTTNVRDGVVNTSEVRYVDAATFERWNRRATPRAGDVLLTREAPVGEVGVLETDEHVFLGQRLMLYRPDPLKITSEYLLAAFQSSYLQAQFGKHGSGTTVKHLPLPACRSFLVPLPPLELQAEFSRRVRALRGLRSVSAEELREWEALFDSLQHKAFVGAL